MLSIVAGCFLLVIPFLQWKGRYLRVSTQPMIVDVVAYLATTRLTQFIPTGKVLDQTLVAYAKQPWWLPSPTVSFICILAFQLCWISLDVILSCLTLTPKSSIDSMFFLFG